MKKLVPLAALLAVTSVSAGDFDTVDVKTRNLHVRPSFDVGLLSRKCGGGARGRAARLG